MFQPAGVWNDHVATTYQEQTYAPTTSYGSFQTLQPYTQPDQHHLQLDGCFQLESNSQQPAIQDTHFNTPYQALEYQIPSSLSSNSGSIASGPSAISSAMGSPYMHAQPSNDWNRHQSFGLLLGIVQSERLAQHTYPATEFDMEIVPSTDKEFVGKLPAFSNSQPPQNVSTPHFPAFPSSLDTFPNLFAPPAPGDTWHLASNTLPETPSPQSLSRQTTFAPSSTSSFDSPSPNDSVFKSPSTPASARTVSPVLNRPHGTGKVPVQSWKSRKAQASSPLNQAMQHCNQNMPIHPQAPAPLSPSQFFSQSSGHFVPPLDYSCPSSFLSPISYSLFLEYSW